MDLGRFFFQALGLRLIIGAQTMMVPTVYDPSELRSDVNGKVVRYLHEELAMCARETGLAVRRCGRFRKRDLRFWLCLPGGNRDCKGRHLCGASSSMGRLRRRAISLGNMRGRGTLDTQP